SSDGKWIIYYELPKEGSILTPGKLMRVPLTGGTPQPILTAPINDHRCARAPSTLCVFGETSSDHKQFLFRAFDVMSGNTRLLATFDTETNGAYNWDLSQDGNRIAIAKIGS